MSISDNSFAPQLLPPATPQYPDAVTLALLTDHQCYLLRHIPEDVWFSSQRISVLSDPEATCQQLVRKGVLEQRSTCPPGKSALLWVTRLSSAEYYEYRRLPAAGPFTGSSDWLCHSPDQAMPRPLQEPDEEL